MKLISTSLIVSGLCSLTFVPAASAAAPNAPYDAHTVIVKYADATSRAQRAIAARRSGVLAQVGRIPGVAADVVRVSGDPATVAQRLNREDAVLYAEPNYILHTAAPQVPDDTYFAVVQDNLDNTGQRGGTRDADIDAPEGWGSQPALIGFPSADSGVKVGLVDTGVMATREELTGKVVDCAGVRSTGQPPEPPADPTIEPGRCADDNGHGTHTAGILAARANNGAGITGVAFNSPLAVCKAMGGIYGGGAVAGIANCITWLSKLGVKIISMSLAGLTPSTTLANAITNASRGALLIAAAGNDNSSKASYPAAYPEVMSVAATDHKDARASFSNYNRDVEIAAPGVNIASTMKDGAYIVLSGTSMATPHVAGVAALIAAGGGTPDQWRTKLQRSVDDLGTPGRDARFGFGRVNLTKALAR